MRNFFYVHDQMKMRIDMRLIRKLLYEIVELSVCGLSFFTNALI
jgi:hypothetical protein